MEALESGKSLESAVKKAFLDKGVKFTKGTLYKNTFTSQYTFVDIFGCNARVDFCYMNPDGKKYLIECKQQKVVGSVDQKFPYIVENAKFMEEDFILLLTGNGVRPKVLEWVKLKSEEVGFSLLTELEELNEVIVETTTCHPFLKWIGGKSRIIEHIDKILPDNNLFKNYYEPFIGGGSVLIHLLNTGYLKDKKVFVSDSNASLINCYNTVKQYPRELIEFIGTLTVSKEDYTSIRTRFNEIKNKKDSIERAGLFIYLNKCSFNGIYRENSKGKMNVPFSNKVKITLVEEGNILKLSKIFQNVTFTCCSFEDIKIENPSFIYVDPPYHNTFCDYSKDKFSEEQQVSLNKFLKNHLVVASNSNTEFIRNLYSDYEILEINTKKSVSSKASSRSENYTELLMKLKN